MSIIREWDLMNSPMGFYIWMGSLIHLVGQRWYNAVHIQYLFGLRGWTNPITVWSHNRRTNAEVCCRWEILFIKKRNLKGKRRIIMAFFLLLFCPRIILAFDPIVAPSASNQEIMGGLAYTHWFATWYCSSHTLYNSLKLLNIDSWCWNNYV